MDNPGQMLPPILKIVFVAALLLFIFQFIAGLQAILTEQKLTQNTTGVLQTKEQVLGTKTQKQRPGFPVRLRIPKIGVDALVINVGLTLSGAMATPNDTVSVGWFDLGVRPGEVGSAVIAGHLDGNVGEEGVFFDLNKLKAGDKLYIEDNKGSSITFAVRKIAAYDPGYADDVFGQQDGVHLNLITCDGVWDKASQSYSKRLVVFADGSD